jgi:hypothetical protein
MWREARAGVSIFMLLGVSWIFGALIDTGDGGSSLTFQYIFAITTTLQGFGVFLLYCVGSSQVRVFVCVCVCVCVCMCIFAFSFSPPAISQAMTEYRRSFSSFTSDSSKSSSTSSRPGLCLQCLKQVAPTLTRRAVGAVKGKKNVQGKNEESMSETSESDSRGGTSVSSQSAQLLLL